MQRHKPIKLMIPELLKLNLDQYLKQIEPGFKYDIFYFYYLINFIVRNQLKAKNKEYIYINLKHLRKSTVYNIDSYLKILKNGEFLITNKRYIPGHLPFGYKINPKFYNSNIATFELKPNHKLFHKILSGIKNKKAHYNRSEPFIKSMRKEFMHLDFNYNAANEWIKSQLPEKQYYYQFSMEQLKDKRFRYFNRNNTNKRLDTNLTNLKSDLKQFIIGDYISIDLKNSQPFILSLLIDTIINKSKNSKIKYLRYEFLLKEFGIKPLKKIAELYKNNKLNYSDNFKLYKSSTLKGTFYDDFIGLYSGNMQRKQVKDIMFKVLFSSNVFYKEHKKIIPYEKEKQVFRKAYPFVYSVIEILKEKQYNKLAIILQKIESSIFIDNISKRLTEESITPLTIHDSLIVKSKHKNKTTQIIRAFFLFYFNLKPNFHIKNLNNKDKNKVIYLYDAEKFKKQNTNI